MGSNVDVIDVEFSSQTETQDFVPELQPVVVVDAPESDLDSGELRKRILDLLKDIEKNKVELCERIYQAQNGMYESWGYATFKEYAHRELSLRYGTACQLSRLGLFKNKYPEVFNKVCTLGISKMEEISRVVSDANADEWIEKGKHLNADELSKEVRNYMKAMVPSDAQDAVANEGATKDSMIEEQLKHLTYSFTHENYMTVCNAVAALQQANQNIRNDAQALTMICADYMSSNNFTVQGTDFVAETLKKYENNFPVRLVVFDTEARQVIHGMPLVKELVKIALQDV